MSLTIYYSDRIEDLANDLKEKLVRERRDADPFAFSTVVVPNTNIAKWLRVRAFADEPSLCMGIEFPFIEGKLFELLSRSLEILKPEDRPKPLPDGAYAVGILSILLGDRDPLLAPFRRYVADGDAGPLSIDSREKARMAWQLASKLAGLMDQYEVYRPEIVANWFRDRGAKGGALAPGSVEAAEAALAKKLFGKAGLYPPGGEKLSLRRLFDRVLDEKVRPSGDQPGDKLPIYFFGLSTLSPLQKEILEWLAHARDVVFYHDNVCLEYWGDIETKKELLRRLPTADADLEMTHPLLQQWGAAGRETLRLLVDLEEKNGGPGDPFPFEWKRLDSVGFGEKETMLAKVQRSIRTFAGEDAAGAGGVRLGEDRVARQDASIQVVAAPGIRREVETVHNAILGAVWGPTGETGRRSWGDGGRCKFSDIAVLVPDMATYRPVIEAVFDGRGQIPYALIDTTASEDSACLQGFLALMALARDGLSRETLFAVLDNPCVQRALSFGPDEAAEWRRYAEGIGAFDGFEDQGDFANLSWERALRRLRLGRVATGRDDLSVWDGGDDASALKFSEIVETLHRELRELAGKRLPCARPPDAKDAESGPPTWADVLRRIANEFLAVERGDKLEGPVKGQVFRTLSSLAAVRGPQPLDFVVSAVEETVGGIQCRKGGYLTDGVTVAGLVPMRPVPFKQVFVLGMGEGTFPGRDSATTLEIAGAARALGDVRPTAVRKQLFLETLMAVKDRLVLSYPCLDPVKDAELFPSGMVCELEKFLSDYVLPTAPDKAGKETPTRFREVRAPLLERAEPDDFLHGGDGHPEKDLPENPVGPIAWTDGWFAGILPTYSDVERRIARGEPAVRDGREAPAGGRVEIRADDLAEFLEKPLRAALRHLCGIGVEGYRDASIDPEAPLEIPDGPVQWRLDRALLDAASGGPPDVRAAYAPFAAAGALPDTDGFFGAYAVDKKGGELANKDLQALKAFADGFLPADWEKPDPVRTVLPAREGSAGAKPLPERLFTARTKDWRASGGDSRILVVGKCGDAGPGEDKRTPFPPKAVLKPFVAWIAKVAGETGADARTLRVGIADIGKGLHNEWKWTATPEEARSWLDEVSGAYLRYLDDPEDETYLDFGYSDLAKAFETAKKNGKIAGRFPADGEGGCGEWRAAVDSFSKAWDGGGKKGFDNGLVVDGTVGPMGRFPGEGDDMAAEKDAAAVKAGFEKRFKRILEGDRAEEGV